MSTVVAKLSVSFALFVASCATGTDSVEYTRAEASVGAGDVGDAASSPRDGALDADVAGPDSASDAAPGVDSQVHPLPNEPWRPLGVVYPTPGATATLKLSALRLYRDIANKQLAPDLIAYEPRYALWSDGARKRRWLYLPQGTSIDTSDPDHWLFPEGAVFFKEFASEDGKRLETRVLARIGPAPSDVFFGSFVWLDDESDAVLAPLGSSDVRGTQHDVPTQDNCGTCHRGEPGRVLGFSAVQQPRVVSSSFVVPGVAYEVPGDAPTRAALGYLHANCAHCHNDDGTARKDTRLTLRLSTLDVIAGQTTIERNTVGVQADHYTTEGLRVQPGLPEASIIVQRMKVRDLSKQMPGLGTERVDRDGLLTIERWIASLVVEEGR